MVKFLIQGSLFGLIFCTAIACNTNRGSTSAKEITMNDTVVITGCQNLISVKEGSVIEIRLEAIQGTGYQWLLKEQSPLLNQINKDELTYAPEKSKEPMTGMKTYQILIFKALKKGEGVISLEYRRTFEQVIENNCIVKIEIN